MNIHNLNALYRDVQFIVSGQSVNEEKFSNNDNFEKTLFVHLQCDRSVWTIHAVTGLVRSNPIIVLVQVTSRAIIYIVLLSLPSESVGSSFSLPYTLVSWCIAEIIKYSYYFMNLIGYIPYFLTWLRYSSFMILYPTGISGELFCIYKAIIYSKSNPDIWSYTLPNQWNFTFSYLYLLIMIVIIYIPGSPILYKHMLSQRQKVLNTSVKTKKVK
ncbi:very-long-chain (3R)-3-hydroxyacyl-CoA dehydratase 2 isoform X2 [Vespula pensylvanica]|uniref:very-long-chain (3R)-3-hydroxyacyl-CoA dehydratase 2 isoform X2 n=1 Tax=Vespula pensylvanica TaxID=30213 RepID=UPI001CBA30B6|nr:very-long-chain (3R)-3-hydroxyacyl-CoA dehydratase 2 isoform X2 [Vespula pensylvanica]